MIYKGINLSTATVFDLTDDTAFLSRYFSKELGILTKDDYLALQGNSAIDRAFDMMEYAEEMGLTELITGLKDAYSDAFNKYFNE